MVLGSLQNRKTNLKYEKSFDLLHQIKYENSWKIIKKP